MTKPIFQSDAEYAQRYLRKYRPAAGITPSFGKRASPPQKLILNRNPKHLKKYCKLLKNFLYKKYFFNKTSVSSIY